MEAEVRGREKRWAPGFEGGDKEVDSPLQPLEGTSVLTP